MSVLVKPLLVKKIQDVANSLCASQHIWNIKLENVVTADDVGLFFIDDVSVRFEQLCFIVARINGNTGSNTL